MYKKKERNQEYLFEELMPFGGQLDQANRWLRIREMIPWEELEDKYRGYFSNMGRPGKDGQMIIGLMLLKHMTDRSDEEVRLELQENVYWQAFCGLEQFEVRPLLNASSLTKLRKRLGVKFVKEMEDLTYSVLVKKKIIKGKGMLVDGTVFPQKVKYPNDVGLLNDVREWIIEQIKKTNKKTGRKIRTYCRNARKVYLNFIKKKQKTKKMIKKAKREMLQYVRRNMRQIKELMKESKDAVDQKFKEKISLAEIILEQQYEMYNNKTRSVKNRVVSFYRGYVRPIKRGKNGKPVEFGPKGALSFVDGFLFLDTLSHDNFSEGQKEIVENQLKKYEKMFKKKPPSFTADKLYGSLTNRKMLKDKEIRGAFKALGRKGKNGGAYDQWFKKKQRQRNQIEGAFGNGKNHYGLEEILYHGVEGAEMWVRSCILGMNLKTALAKI
ncbi:MAG: IS5 family transposase [Patescibacteria group bacterium]|nr:IS5 family transposase [Patescibacteria group bacterium]